MFVIKPVWQGSGCTCGFLWIFAIFWNGIVSVFLLASWFARGSIGNTSLRLFLIPFVLVGLAVLGAAIWRSLHIIGKTLKFGEAEAMISQQQVRVGESFHFTFRQSFRGTVTTESIALRLVLRETATYRRGTDTQTVIHEHLASEATHLGQSYGSSQSFYDARMFQIPRNGMHTFVGQRNRLQWFVKVEFALAGWPNVTELYEINVVPERVPVGAYGD